MKAVVIGGVTSGVGKTTLATGIMGAMARRGLKVQPYKVGPDYIDTTYHTWFTGFPSRNLDTWMCPRSSVLDIFLRSVAGKDIAIIEGVMGLYDGHSPTSDSGSTAEVAKLLRAPVILVVDARNGARSMAALVKGYVDFDPSIWIPGVILNGIASRTHYEICRKAIEHYTGASVVGYLPGRDDLRLPERHLGLIPTVEGPAGEGFRELLIQQVEATVDLAAILRLAEDAGMPSRLCPGKDVPVVSPTTNSQRRALCSGEQGNTRQDTGPLYPSAPVPPEVRIAVARDRAFSFYYQDNLDLLEAWGAELVYFSPLADPVLPPGVGGVYVGGGFPELYAAELAANVSMKTSLRSAAEAGVPVYAECGGLMYLGESIRRSDGQYPMVGVLPVTTRFDTPRLTLGYRTVRALKDGLLLARGEQTRGHEFHWSRIESHGDASPAYQVEETGAAEGFQIGNVVASYIHLHFGSSPSLAPRFVNTCRQFRGREEE